MPLLPLSLLSLFWLRLLQPFQALRDLAAEAVPEVAVPEEEALVEVMAAVARILCLAAEGPVVADP